MNLLSSFDSTFLCAAFVFFNILSFVLGTPVQCVSDNDCRPFIVCEERLCLCNGEMCGRCDENNGCPAYNFICLNRFCRVPSVTGERCEDDADCHSNELECYGKGEARACRCRKMPIWDLKNTRCIKENGPNPFDPVHNFIIPAIIVMSVGAMVYLGTKLFCNCGKLWRRRRSQLSRELENMTSSPHQQGTWVASYRVFSPMGNQNQANLHPPPCMGGFVPSFISSPPPYEEALKHKVILSSFPDAPITAPLPAYSLEPPPPMIEEPPPTVIPTQPLGRGRNIALSERDQRPLRYYPGEGNPQVPAVWNNARVNTVEEVTSVEALRETPRPTSFSVFRQSRGTRMARASRHFSPETLRRPPEEQNS